MRKILLLLALLALMPLQGDTDPYKEGEILYAQKGCNGCHGIYGEGLSNYPRIVHKPHYLLVKKLKFYRGKKGVMDQAAQIMIPFAENLSDSEINYLSVYLSSYRVEEDAPRYELQFETWGDGGS